MAEQNNTIKTTVILNTSQAEQEVVKLNAAASDTTKTLEERIAAKNKQVGIQNQLSKQTLNALNNERRTLEGKGASEKDLMAIKKKLDKANLKAIKTSENNTKSQNKLTAAYKKSKNPVENLDKATGGLIGKMKLFLANPIGIVLTALVGVFALVNKAINSTEDGAASFNAVMAALGQVFTNLITFISDLVQPLFEWLADFLSKDLGGAFEAMGGYVDAAKLGFEAFLNVIKLMLTPLRSLIALAQAAALAVKGDFEGAKQVMVDFKDSVVDAAVAITTNLVEALDKVVETNADVAESFNSATDSADSLIARATQIELRQNEFNKARRAQLLSEAKLSVLSRQALADAKDLSKTDAERFASLEKFKDLETKIAGDKKRSLEQEIQLQRDRMSLGGNTQEDNEKLNNLLIQREAINEKLAKQEGKFQSLNIEFFNLAKAARLSEQKDKIALEKIALDRLKGDKEATLEIELEFLEKTKALELENDLLTKTQKEIIEQTHLDNIAAIKQSYKDIEDEAEAAELEVQLLKDEAEIESKRLHGENVLALELELLEARRLQELANKELTEAEILLIDERYSAAKKKLTEDTQRALKASVDQAAQQGLEAAADAFGISQELRVAQLAMAAPEAVGNSFAKAAEVYPAPLSLAMGAAGAAGVIVPIIKGLSDIKKARFPGSKKSSRGGGGRSISMSTGSTGGAISTSAITDIAANNAARLGTDPSLGANATAIASDSVVGGTSSNVVFSENKYNEFQNQVGFKEDKISIS